VAQWTFDHKQAAGRGTSTLPAAAALYLPLSSSDRAVGVLGIPLTDPAQFRDPARRRLLEALAGQTAAALERLALAEHSRETEVEVEAERLRTELVQSQLEALKMQLHPHFLFNTLHSISALLNKDVGAARSMITRLGDFLRLTLENVGTQEVTLQQEMEFLNSYLEIERVRFRSESHPASLSRHKAC